MSCDGELERLLDEVADNVARRGPWQQFSPAIERRYDAMVTPRRTSYVMRFGTCSMLFYNLYLFTDRLMIPDVFRLAIILQLGVITPIAFAAICVMRHRQELSGYLLTGIMCLIMAATIFLFCCSRAPGALFLPFTFVLITMTAVLMVSLPFRFGVIYACATTLASVISIAWHPGYDGTIRMFTLLFVLGSSAYTVFVGYRMEASERRAYLLTLRESLRAEMLSMNNQQLRDLSDTDGLTGIGNRRFFEASLGRLWGEALAGTRSMGLLLIDIDHFKQLNDTYGHQAGDRCLCLVAETLRELTRGSLDIAARFGGEEFAMLLPGASLAQVQDVAERLRRTMEDLRVPLGGAVRPGVVRVSIGCDATVPEHEASSADLVTGADTALYCAKRAGRNRIHPPAEPAQAVAA